MSRLSATAPSAVPFELQAIDADAVGLLMGCAARTVLETIACRPDFPKRVSLRPATLVAGEVIAYRAKMLKADRPVRRRRPGNTASAT